MTEQIAETLQLDRVKFLLEQIKSAVPMFEELAGLSEEAQNKARDLITQYALSLRGTRVKTEELEGFFKKPYHLMPVRKTKGEEPDAWYLLMPRFIDAAFGYLDHQTDSFNVFIINRYVEWLGALPEELKRQLGWKTPLQLEMEGTFLKGPPDALKEAWTKYRPYLSRQEKEGIVINQKTAFQLIASLVKDGILPFTPKPVLAEDQVERPVKFELFDYQRDAWKEFLRYGNIGVFYPASVGKTFLAMWIMSHVKGPHLVVAPTRILVEQWQERLSLFTDLKEGVDYAVTTYQGAKKYMDRVWSSEIIDEVHHLPADQFVKLSFIKRKYTVGLSASPQREDGREHYIFALTGKPVGLGWEHFRKLGIIRSPTLNVHLVKDFNGKLGILRRLLVGDKKTIIFADSIEIGKTIAARFQAPHVHGETKEDRLKTIQDARLAVVSRVGDEGVSLPDIEQVIEIDWLYGSRRQELQRFTRTLHSKQKEPEYHILMTGEEYLHDRKRLFSVMDKGFAVKIHEEGVSQEALAKRLREGTPIRLPRQPSPKEEPVSPTVPVQSTPSNIAGILELPGVKRTMAQLTGSQRKVYQLLLQNDGTWFKKGKLPLLLGYNSPVRLDDTVHIGELVKRGLIERGRVDGETAYRTNVSARMA